ncbi:MAG: radical SAM protein [archaeon]
MTASALELPIQSSTNVPTFRFLLVNPPFLTSFGIKESGGHAMPLGLMYIASYVRKYVPSIQPKILDCELDAMTDEQIREKFIREKADFVVMTVPTPTVNACKRISDMAKEVNPHCKVVWGGLHPTVFPKECVSHPSVDFAVVGEGEQVIRELVEHVLDGKKDFSDVKGIGYKDEHGGVFQTGMQELIQDIDSIPFPAYDLIDVKRYHTAPSKKLSNSESTMNIMTSRGCAFDCIHCISKTTWRRKMRFRSPKNVADEMEYCVKTFGVKEFNFMDDLFGINEKRVIDVCAEITRRKLDARWVAFARTDTITEPMLRAMKEAGCVKISMGIESGNQDVLNKMRKSLRLDQVKKGIKLMKKHGFEVHSSFMLGNVGDTDETIQDTIRFAKELDLDNATFFITSPYPGTDLYGISMEQGFVTSQTPWEDFIPLGDRQPLLVQGAVPYERLIQYQKQAFKEFYLRPSVLVKKFFKIRSVSDIRTLVEGLTVFKGIMEKKEENPDPPTAVAKTREENATGV